MGNELPILPGCAVEMSPRGVRTHPTFDYPCSSAFIRGSQRELVWSEGERRLRIGWMRGAFYWVLRFGSDEKKYCAGRASAMAAKCGFLPVI